MGDDGDMNDSESLGAVFMSNQSGFVASRKKSLRKVSITCFAKTTSILRRYCLSPFECSPFMTAAREAWTFLRIYY